MTLEGKSPKKQSKQPMTTEKRKTLTCPKSTTLILNERQPVQRSHLCDRNHHVIHQPVRQSLSVAESRGAVGNGLLRCCAACTRGR